MPNNSTTLAKALTSNNVYFDSAKVRAANGAKSAKLYAPSIWRQGSSYSHLDEAIFPAGDQELPDDLRHRRRRDDAPPARSPSPS